MNRHALALALTFLTRLPVRIHQPVTDADQGEAALAWPLAGLLIGALLSLLTALLQWSGLSPWPTAILIVGAWAALTGGLHLDGLADSADGWVGGQGERERTLRIMKDPACGPVGVTALVLVLMAKVMALGTLLSSGHGWLAALLLTPMLARSGCLALFLCLPYVREQGLGDPTARHLPRASARALLGLIGLATLWLAPLMLTVAVLVALLAMRAMKQRLGGFTGDTAGAMTETLEAALLLACCMA